MNPLAADLDHVLAHTRGLWEELRGQRIFITGGTGFFGCWLLESLVWANDHLALDTTAVVLTRDPATFQKKAPHLANHPSIQMWPGDIRSFPFPKGPFSHVIHGATEADPQIMASDPLQVFDVNVEGTRRVLDCACQGRARRFLFTSSGAVYGPQPHDLAAIPESFAGGPDPTDVQSLYGAPGEGKRAAETLCSLYARQFGLETVIARCFAFVGPHLPLGGKFAIGNFIRDALRGGPIQVNGDGTPTRSYLYAADLAVWLWTLLLRGQSCRPYNVGSDLETTIAQTARLVQESLVCNAGVVIAQQPDPARPASRYVPCIKRARTELGLSVWVDLPESIRRTAHWARTCGSGLS